MGSRSVNRRGVGSTSADTGAFFFSLYFFAPTPATTANSLRVATRIPAPPLTFLVIVKGGHVGGRTPTRVHNWVSPHFLSLWLFLHVFYLGGSVFLFTASMFTCVCEFKTGPHSTAVLMLPGCCHNTIAIEALVLWGSGECASCVSQQYSSSIMTVVPGT